MPSLIADGLHPSARAVTLSDMTDRRDKGVAIKGSGVFLNSIDHAYSAENKDSRPLTARPVEDKLVLCSGPGRSRPQGSVD
jgi:hypothetical protein